VRENVAYLRAPRMMFAPLCKGLLVYRPDKGNDKDRGDQHQRPGGDKAQRDEEDRACLCMIPGLGSPHEGEQRSEEGEEDQDHAPRQVHIPAPLTVGSDS
jgi:hypothetical protein